MVPKLHRTMNTDGGEKLKLPVVLLFTFFHHPHHSLDIAVCVHVSAYVVLPGMVHLTLLGSANVWRVVDLQYRTCSVAVKKCTFTFAANNVLFVTKED